MAKEKSKKPAHTDTPAQPYQERKIEVVKPGLGVSPRGIVVEMEESYLDYAMSVIVQRALPDVRDGMKPVHRRILYAMWGIGLRAGAKYRKSATVVGEVLGKYHPHGDVAVYDAMVRLAQDFSMRYPLVDGQGNFGSMDGDSPAAMRYTEARLTRIAEEILTDIEKDTVEFMPNYDGAHQEPRVLPAKLPNLMLTGTTGIAVGMATSIPPHNLRELVDGITHLIDHPDTTVGELMKYIPGPDFPTGGTIYNGDDIRAAYATGKGSIVMRAVTDIQETKSGSYNIVVSEIPYQVNKATMLEHIAQLVKDKKIEGIKDLRDESDRDGVRVVIELRKDAYPKKILNRLFQLTNLQTSFHVNMLALVDGIEPRVLTLKMVLEEHVKHRKDVIRRRTTYDLDRAKERAHILEGLRIALLKIDAIITTIKKSKDKDEAKTNLIKKFKLSERQAVAILEMKLQQLANLERMKVEQEYKEKQQLIKELQAILKSEQRILAIIKTELADLREKYGDDRRTKINKGAVGEFSQEDLIPNEPAVIMVTHQGYIKRLPPETFRRQSRGGKGVIGMTTKEEDTAEHLLATMTHADLLCFTTKGRVFQLKAYDVPPSSRTAKGQALVNFLQLGPDEKVTSILSLTDLTAYKYLAMVTRGGVIKRVALTDFSNVRRSGLIAIRLKRDDILEWVKPTTGDDDLILVSQGGQAIRSREKTVRVMGRNASGVRGIRVKKGDAVAGMDVIPGGKGQQGAQLLVVMANGFGKRTGITQYKVQGRGGSGIKTAKITSKTGNIVAAFVATAERAESDLVIISDKGQVIRLPIKSVSVLGRATQGVRLMRFSETGDGVANVTVV